MTRFVRATALVLLAPPAGAVTFQSSANPIRKVVTMLQAMQTKVGEEGAKAEELFGKFQCYCKNSGGDLAQSIEASQTKLAELGPSIEASEGKKAKLEGDLTSEKADRETAKAAMSEATALRAKEKAAFDTALGESQVNLAAMEKAIAALEHGMAGGFLQTGAASVLRTLVSVKDLNLADDDKSLLSSFLSTSTSSVDQYAPQSGEIVGILKQLKDEMSKDKADVIAAEETASKQYDALMVAKNKEVKALSKSIETKLMRVGELGLEIATAKSDLGDAFDSLEDDQKFLADLDKNCDSKAKVHEEEKKMRAEELLALADTIKVLNDDDALDLFKKTLPGSATSFLQVQRSTSGQRGEAMDALRLAAQKAAAAQGSHKVDLVMLALNGKAIGFDKVVTMIDELIGTLKQEQKDDEVKKEYCSAEFEKADDKKTSLVNTLADVETLIAQAQESISTTTEEILALKASIVALDKSVAEATEQRKAENAEFKELMANDGTAKELMLFAKNRLSKFYNPKMFKAPPKQELSEEDKIFVANGGTPPPTEAPGGIAGTGISVNFLQVANDDQVAPPPPPATAEAYKKKGEETNGVMAMIDLLLKDLEKEMTTAAAEEKAAQADYEQMMSDSAEKRSIDAKSLGDKESALANLKSALEGYTDDKASNTKELMATEAYIQSLQAECDWLLKYFDVRKQARSDEVDSLGKAKAVLAGADYSFFQRTATRKYLRQVA